MHSQVVRTLRWPTTPAACYTHTWFVSQDWLPQRVFYSWEQVKLKSSSVKSEAYPDELVEARLFFIRDWTLSDGSVPQMREALLETLHCWL